MVVEAAATHARGRWPTLAQSAPFDAAMLDLQLPDTDGFDLAREIRNNSYGRFLPCCLLSSHPPAQRRSPRRRTSTLPSSSTNPFRPAQLLDALCRALSVPVQRDKKASFTPGLDSDFARRLPLRVLLADDNPINQKVGLSVLHKLGYRAEVAHNGLEVIKALEQKPFDLLFLDVQMPEMDGLECAQLLTQRWTRDRRPIIIAMTGNALMGDREKCLAAGMDDYISKPVRIADLQAALERWGPLKSAHTATKILVRTKTTSPDELVDQAIMTQVRKAASAQGSDLLQEVIDQFLEHVPQRLAQLNQHIRDPANLAVHAQALKTMSTALGAKRMATLCQKLEALGLAGAIESAPVVLHELHATFALTRRQLLPLAAPSSLESSSNPAGRDS